TEAARLRDDPTGLTGFLDRVGVEVLDPRSSHRQFRCRKCGATWRPRRELSGRLSREDWLCWRGCNSTAGPGEESKPG
ncbi:MAG TPA: hypothetical protein VKE50_07240, partial [Thermoanaerobaculia bacterium]|nr:hypothetical protein [Thermoanaerobaculia bacterium]